MALSENAKKQALALMKTRTNRTPGDASLDEMYSARLDAAEKRLERTGITMTDSLEDVMLLVDQAVYDYQNRDKQTGEPDWLRMRKRERWLAE